MGGFKLRYVVCNVFVLGFCCEVWCTCVGGLRFGSRGLVVQVFGKRRSCKCVWGGCGLGWWWCMWVGG